MVTQDGTGEEDFAALLAESFGQDSVKEGEILRGTVIAVGKDYAIVDVGYKSEGQVRSGFRQADGSRFAALSTSCSNRGTAPAVRLKERTKVWDGSAPHATDKLIEQ
jgi:hypothetical protein